MRIRTIKPEFWTSLTIARLPLPTRLQFIGLWNYADDEGRGVDDPRLIKAALWPLDEDVTADFVEQFMVFLAAEGLIVRYSTRGGRYFSVRGWGEHQSISRPRPSKLPEPSMQDLELAYEGSTEEGKGREQGKEQGREEVPAPTTRRERPRDEIWDVLVAAFNEPTPSARGAWNAAAKVLRDYGADAGEIRGFILTCRSGENSWAVKTPTAVAKHFGSRQSLMQPNGSKLGGTLARNQAIADRLRAEGR